jgi:alkanesulfonate monooxygenase SsuD/methylene tetrahydromethanopterin reductase-like flavin-dependent oxidoreductase (luciferase family)
MIAADGEHGAERAARLADILMVDPTEPWDAVDDAVQRFDTARKDREGEVVLLTYGGVSERGRADAWAPVEDGFRTCGTPTTVGWGRELTREIPPASYRLLLGTPSEVAEQAREYRSRYGDRVHLVLRCNYPGMPAQAVAGQLRLWGEAAAAARTQR